MFVNNKLHTNQTYCFICHKSGHSRGPINFRSYSGVPKNFPNGSIQTLFLWNLKSLNFEIWIKPSESASKMSQKPKIWGPVTFKKCSKFSIQSFETLTHNCGKTVNRIKILTCAYERGPRDLWRMVLWRYTKMVDQGDDQRTVGTAWVLVCYEWKVRTRNSS